MIKKRTFLAAAAALVALFIVGRAVLGSGGSGFEISWWTVEGGGGVASGSTYTLHGSIGQPDAGPASGSGRHLQGGFWAIPGGTDTPTPTTTPPATSTNTPPATSTPTITVTPSPGPSSTATNTATPGPSPTATETGTATPTATNTATPGPSPTPTDPADYSSYIPAIMR